jgi:hypothetical protein
MVINCKRGGSTCIGKTAIIFDYDSTNLFIDTIHEATGKANLLHRITTTTPIGSSGTAIYNYEMYEGWNERPSGTCNFMFNWGDNNRYIVTGSHSVKIDSIRRDNEPVVDFYKNKLKKCKT